MNLRDMEYIIAIADEKNFGRAAERCHVSQSTLSIQIKKLEDYLGVQIFERSKKSVMLTAAGEKIHQRAKQMVRQAEEIRQIAREARDPLAGEVIFGAFPTLAPYLFPLCLGAIKKALPKVRLRLTEEKTDVLLERLSAGKIDCALIAAPVTAEHIKSIPLFYEPFYVAVPAVHPLAEKKHITDSELAGLDLLLLDEGHCLRSQALEICHSIGRGETGSFRATSLETLRQMVSLGQAVTLVPKFAIRPKDKDVHYIPLRNPSFGRAIMLCYRDTDARAALFAALAKSITQIV